MSRARPVGPRAELGPRSIRHFRSQIIMSLTNSFPLHLFHLAWACTFTILSSSCLRIFFFLNSFFQSGLENKKFLKFGHGGQLI